jgi:hypothetical protein
MMKWIAPAVATVVLAVLPVACGGSAASACSSICDKGQSCGDINSVQGDQCRAKCDSEADTLQNALDKCTNESDIVSANDDCLSRACSDYGKCLLTLPSCKQ